MRAFTKATAGAVFAGSLLLTGGIAPAIAQPVVQDGLVNVNVGDVTIEDAVDINAAVAAAITACDVLGVKVNQVAVLARAIAVDRTGGERTICNTSADRVTITNN